MKPSTLNLISGILGIWIILVVVLGFSSTLSNFFLILSGAAVAFLSYRIKPFLESSLESRSRQNDSEISPDDDNDDTKNQTSSDSDEAELI
jgi:hypothetical protein